MAFAYGAVNSACLVICLGNIEGGRRPRVTGLRLCNGLTSSLHVRLEDVCLADTLQKRRAQMVWSRERESAVAYGVGLLGKARYRKHANRREDADQGSIKLWSILL
jgi:hypothetical protein